MVVASPASTIFFLLCLLGVASSFVSQSPLISCLSPRCRWCFLHLHPSFGTPRLPPAANATGSCLGRHLVEMSARALTRSPRRLSSPKAARYVVSCSTPPPPSPSFLSFYVCLFFLLTACTSCRRWCLHVIPGAIHDCPHPPSLPPVRRFPFPRFRFLPLQFVTVTGAGFSVLAESDFACDFGNGTISPTVRPLS